VAPIIRVGDTGAAVRDLQRRLIRWALQATGAGGLPPPVDELLSDGVFGPVTTAAVRHFQRERGLAADGIVGPESWRALVEAGYALGDRLLWHSRIMMRGDDVRELQTRLNQLGFDAGAEDGIFGPLAHAVVEELQRNIGLEVDGVAGPGTIAALRRLHRDHHSGGIGVRAREREWLRRLSARGLSGARVLVDPSHGPDDPGHRGPGGANESEVAWQIATLLSARLSAQGAHATLARGPASTPTATERARLANELGVDLVVSIALNGLTSASARGASAYYFGSATFVSEAGMALAAAAQAAMIAAGWRPDCRIHPMTWGLLRETRMPAVVVEPGFLTSPADEARLTDPAAQDALAAALAGAVARFLAAAVPAPVPV
jgi:N-acetylmuramoyl-L-alanine amidase